MALRITLSNFSYVDRTSASRSYKEPIKPNLALRFTWGLEIDVPNSDVATLAIEGCLSYYSEESAKGGLVWTTPITRFSSRGATKGNQLHWVSPYLYVRTLNALLSQEKLLQPVWEAFDINHAFHRMKQLARDTIIDPESPREVVEEIDINRDGNPKTAGLK